MPASWLWSCWLFKKHDFIYKILEFSSKGVIIAKRLYCSNSKGNEGCGRTCRLQINICIYQLCYAALHLWLFLSLHYIGKKSIKDSYYEATGTKDARNAYRWLQKLIVQMPIIKNTIPPPENFFSSVHDNSVILSHMKITFSVENPLPFFQSAFQKHFING